VKQASLYINEKGFYFKTVPLSAGPLLHGTFRKFFLVNLIVTVPMYSKSTYWKTKLSV